MQGVDNNIRYNTVKEVSQQLDESQPTKRRIDVDTEILTRNYLDRVYLNTIDKEHAMDDVKNEFKRVGFHSPEKTSGSRDKPKHGGPESSIEPKGKRGRPSKYMNTDDNFWKNKKLQTIVNEFNTITGESIEIHKVGKKRSSICEQWQCNDERPNYKILTEHNKTMQSQATRGM